MWLRSIRLDREMEPTPGVPSLRSVALNQNEREKISFQVVRRKGPPKTKATLRNRQKRMPGLGRPYVVLCGEKILEQSWGRANDISEKSTLQIAHSRAIGQLVRDIDDITRTRMPTSLKGNSVSAVWSRSTNVLPFPGSHSYILPFGVAPEPERENDLWVRHSSHATEGRKAMMVAGGINIRGMG